MEPGDDTVLKSNASNDAASNESYSVLNPPGVVSSNDHFQGHCSHGTVIH